MNDLIELDYLLSDIAEMIDRAERMAGEISGEDGGRAPIDEVMIEMCPECSGKGFHVVTEGGLQPRPEKCPACGGMGTYPYHYTDPGSPPVEGWPAMVKLAGILGSMAETLRVARAGEVAEAIIAARKESMDAPEPIQPGDYHYYNR